MSPAHRFIRNSIAKRVYLAASPRRFCATNNRVVEYRGYNFNTSSIDDSSPGGTEILMTNNITSPSQVFELSGGTEDRNTAVGINLTFIEGSLSLTIPHQILVRNVQ